MIYDAHNQASYKLYTWEDSVCIEIFPNVNITLHNGAVAGLMNTSALHADEGRFEEGLRTSEPLITNRDHL